MSERLTYAFGEEIAHPDGRVEVPMPTVPICVVSRNAKKMIPLEPLVDTGAAYSRLPCDLMERLDIRPEDCESVPTKKYDGGIYMEQTMAIWLGTLVPVPGDSGAAYFAQVLARFGDYPSQPVVGREDFLKFFSLTLDCDERTFQLEPKPGTQRIVTHGLDELLAQAA
jgi:hypothetical protein